MNNRHEGSCEDRGQEVTEFNRSKRKTTKANAFKLFGRSIYKYLPSYGIGGGGFMFKHAKLGRGRPFHVIMLEPSILTFDRDLYRKMYHTSFIYPGDELNEE